MAGPFAAQRLGDLGADVIKIEPPAGEWQRHAPAGGIMGNKINVSFLSLNRNKRSLAIDLKSAGGKEIIHKLAAQADVFIQNYRPGVAGRLGVDYETLSALNPRLIYVSMSGFGEDGPYATRPGQDLLLGEPTFVGGRATGHRQANVMMLRRPALSIMILITTNALSLNELRLVPCHDLQGPTNVAYLPT